MGLVRIVLLLLAGVLILGLGVLPLGTAEAKCTAAQRETLQEKGMTKKEIREFCAGRADNDDDDDWDRSRGGGRGGNPGGGGNQMGAATVCMTQMGACPMMVPVPIGQICNCGGRFPGIAR
jgi:hypothetical protein